jgi:hypothetical protein
MNFPSVDQFRHVVKFMKDRGVQRETFRGTVKIHGTNARITVNEDDSRTYGSKNQDGLASGHYGFVEWAQSHTGIVALSAQKPYTIYGEWAGKGIMAGVPYEKQFFPFAVFSEKTGLWNFDDVVNHTVVVSDFPVEIIDVYLDDIDRASSRLMEIVNQVELECPVAKSFGFAIPGEGYVFTPVGSKNPGFGFKVKGERHSTTKVKNFNTVKIDGLDEFVSATATEARFKQALEEVGVDIRLTGKFIKWVLADVEKEDLDLLPEGADKRPYMKKVGTTAAQWYKKVATQI